jgi:N-acetylmuramoyl-L-alanine amidase
MSKIMKINKSKKFTEFFDEVKDWRQIDFLVLHHVQARSSDHAIEQFKNYKVSSHFLIDEAGEIFELVEENNISYHAGISFWNGVDGLNKTSIGIEFINSSPFENKFSEMQMIAGVQLCKYIAAKYKIRPKNIVGHSDIAYSRDTQLLDRKQDPSHLFDWKFLAENGVGIFPEIKLFKEGNLFELGNKSPEIAEIKRDLKFFGYRVINLNDEFDEEMRALVRIFNRRFLGKELDIWCENSRQILDKLLIK